MNETKKGNEKEKQTSEDAFFKTAEKVLCGMLSAFLSPPRSPMPPVQERPIVVQFMSNKGKKGVIRRFFQWLW